MALRGLNTPLPIYVTRKTADGVTGQYTLSAWMPLLVIFLAFANAVVWGIVGLIVAVRVAF